ncbi:MAG: response regulator [Flavobacteriales bacterium]|nr:response regulator [Flavobacteriales bacterium]
MWNQGLPLSFQSVMSAQASQPLLWIIDSAPLILGVMAAFIGKKQRELIVHNEQLDLKVKEKTQFLEEKNHELKGEIEIRKRTEKALIKAKEEAEDAKHAEERFLANMSHEIRTPLNSIVGFTRLLIETEVDEQQSEYLKSIKYASNHLLAIINDILELSKIKAGQIEFEQYPINLRDLLGSVINTIAISARNKGLEVGYDIDDEAPEGIKGDTVRISQVLLNLLNNAVKFTSNGSVKLHVSTIYNDDCKCTARMRFEVVDTGIGIPADKLESIFDDFKQAESSTTRLYGGTGLGLAISRKLVDLQGGSLEVTSQLGEGSTFYFEVEYPTCEAKPEEEDAFNLHIKDGNELHARVLLAEDNDMNRVLAEKVFEVWGSSFELDFAINGKEAIEKFMANDYDLVLMDLQMPIMDGFTACEFIRTELDPPKRDTPIIALTADVLASERKRAFQVGMNEYVTKPFKPQELYFKMFKTIKEYRDGI